MLSHESSSGRNILKHRAKIQRHKDFRKSEGNQGKGVLLGKPDGILRLVFYISVENVLGIPVSHM